MAGVMSAGYGLSGIISPQTFQDKDAPGYLPAKVTVLVTQAAAGFTFFILFLYYVWENRRRDRKAHSHGITENGTDGAELTEEEAWGGLTDKQNWAKYRYVY
jgi:hypothetical protein